MGERLLLMRLRNTYEWQTQKRIYGNDDVHALKNIRTIRWIAFNQSFEALNYEQFLHLKY